MSNAPDEPGILTWLYPFKEYGEIAKKKQSQLNILFFHDWFVRNAINSGLPLNTLMSTDEFTHMGLDSLEA